MNGNISFGLPGGKKTFLDPYIGKWVVLDTVVPRLTYAGKVDQIKDGWIQLMPYIETTYNKRGICVKTIIENGLPQISIINTIIGVSPTSREIIEEYCNDNNKENLTNYLERENKLEEILSKSMAGEYYKDGAGI